MRRLWLALGLCAAVAAGCSDDSGTTPQDMGGDTVFYPEDMGTVECGTDIYPCGPYGVESNDIAANLEFLGFSDAQEHCTAHKDKALDASNKHKIAFKDWYLGDSSCAASKRQLLWVMVSAGWCGPCQQEVKATQDQYSAGAVDERVGILNLVFETDQLGQPITEEFLQKWIKAFNLTMPVAMDPSFRMGAYFDKNATPFNMLVETSTMKIIYRQTGGDLSNIGKKIQAYFSGQ